MRFVRRADFHHGGVAERHDVRDAEGSADLHEFAAGYDRLVAGGELGEHHHDGGGVVVDG